MNASPRDERPEARAGGGAALSSEPISRLEPLPSEPLAALPPGARLVGVRLRAGARAEEYLVEGFGLRVGEHCVVEVTGGHAVGEVRRPPRPVSPLHRDRVYPRVLRPASPAEVDEHRRHRAHELAAMQVCQDRARGRGLALKVVDVELAADGRRATVLFAADQRVDFRELVRDLGRELRARIEMRQVGARDVTRVQDGIGPCGRALCCGSHLRRFEPISVKMAKVQDVPLNDSRLLGNCGRLKCCLLYELAVYEELRARLPRPGAACQADCGEGRVLTGRVRGVKVLRETVLVAFADGTEAEIPLAQVTWEGRRHGPPHD